MEICCTPNGILSEVVQQSEGSEDAAVRCSLFNVCDLSKGSGVRLAWNVLTWKSLAMFGSARLVTLIGLFNTNERTESQRQELAEKRKHAKKLYVGASVDFQKPLPVA